MTNNESENFIKRHARSIVLVTSLGGSLVSGAVAVDKAQNAIDLNNQIHSTSPEQKPQLHDEFYNEFWGSYYALISTLILTGVSGYSVIEIFNTKRNNPSSSAS